jgi:hypoxanthine phosphoribosyltransferase
MTNVPESLESILLTQEQLHKRVCELGEQITRDYEQCTRDGKLLVVCMLQGAFIFMSDLVRNINLHCELDFMIASSYGNQTESSGEIKIIQDVQKVEGQHVLLVEDIVDSGNTMKYVLELLKGRKPASLALCTLLDKPDRRKAP